jgi:hypothetical protein
VERQSSAQRRKELAHVYGFAGSVQKKPSLINPLFAYFKSALFGFILDFKRSNWMIEKPVSVMIIDAVPADIYSDRPKCPSLVERRVDNDKKVFVVIADHASPCLASVLSDPT